MLGPVRSVSIRNVIRFGVASLVLVSVVGCTAAAATPTHSAQPQSAQPQSAQLPRSNAASPSPSPQFAPGPSFAVGTVTRIDQGRVAIRNPDEELEVDLTRVRSVWKETEVSPAELEVGDELSLNGTRDGATFRAGYVWANIGRVDGVIRAVVGAKFLLVALPPKTFTTEMELSRYVEIVQTDGRPAMFTDLRPGMTIGAVVYRPRNSTMRATKVWF
jgi:hypothetical protein